MSAYNKTKWCLPLDALSAKNIFVSADSFQKLLMNYSKRKSLRKNVGLIFFVSNYIHQIKENMQLENITAQLLSVFQASHHTGRSYSLVRYHSLLKQTEI